MELCSAMLCYATAAGCTYRLRNFWRRGYWWVHAGTLWPIQALHLRRRATERSALAIREIPATDKRRQEARSCS